MKRKVLLSAALASVFAAGTAFAQSKYTDKDLVWQDDFNTGNTINQKFWSYEPHEPGWVNNELQSYGTDTKNTYVKDGNLVIQAIRNKNSDGSYSYTSGRINTQNKKTFKYGRFEARIKFPKGQGFLPAFWMMPNDESFYGQWPKCGEIDIAEVLGNKTDTLYGTIHYGEPHGEKQGTYTAKGKDFHDDFHVMAVEWEPGELRYYCDGELYKTINDWFTKRPGFEEVTYPAPFDQPFYIILNLAVGGNWPGNPDDSTKFDENAQMLVDYVKVYQKKSYNENVKKPAGEKIVIKADTTGNLVKSNANAWQFMTAGTGKGALKVNGGELTISATDSGALDYSIQVVQPEMPMEQGKVYKYSFDAYADAPRTMITGITAPNSSYARMFGDEKVSLTKTKKHFEYTFNHLQASDPQCRIEYNLGNQDSTATVYVSNVRLEQTGNVDYSKLVSGILPDGNYIHNGQFQEGEARLGYWNIEKGNADVAVTNIDGVRELLVKNSKCKKLSDVKAYQKNILLPKNKNFVIKFDARSTKAGNIEVVIGNEKFSPKLSKKTQHFEYTFKTGDYGEKGTDVTFNLGLSKADVALDNVELKENVIIKNGDFDEDMAGYEVYANDAARTSHKIVNEGGNKCFAMTIDETGNTDWFIQLKQNNVTLEKDKSYKLGFSAKCDIEREIMIALQRDGSKDNDWEPYSGNPKYNLNGKFQKFEVDFTMKRDTDNAVILCISMGAINGKQISKKHTIYIDSIVVTEVK